MDEPIISPDTKLRGGRAAAAGHHAQVAGAARRARCRPSTPRSGTSPFLFPIPLVNAVKQFTWSQFCGLPRLRVFAYHALRHAGRASSTTCRKRVATRELLNHVTVWAPRAKFVMVHCEYGFQHEPAHRRLLRRRLPLRDEAQRRRPLAGSRLPAAISGAEALRLEECEVGARRGVHARKTARGSGRVGSTAATTCAATVGGRTLPPQQPYSGANTLMSRRVYLRGGCQRHRGDKPRRALTSEEAGTAGT